MKKNNYYIVAPSHWNEDQLRYRRHRLAEYLNAKPDSQSVSWIYPCTGTALKKEVLDNGITLIGIPDLKGYFGYFQFLGWVLFRFMKMPFKTSVQRNVLCFTHPIFSALTKTFQWDLVVYDCSDLWGETWSKKKGIARTVLSKIRGNLIRGSEMEIIKSSQLLFSTSSYLEQHVKQYTAASCEIIENGVELDMFIDHNETMHIDEGRIRPKLGFVGGIKAKIDFKLIEYLAVNRPGWDIYLIGPVHSSIKDEFIALSRLSNVIFKPAIKPQEVPACMRGLDVGLLVYKNIEYNKAVSPLKLFEYLCSGIPVVGSGVPETIKYQEAGVFYYANEYKAFMECCERAIELSADLAFTSRRIQVATQHNWDKKLEKIYQSMMYSEILDTNLDVQKSS